MKMQDDEKPRSIRFPEKLWNVIDADARRCKRSAVKQMEAVLAAYYDLENVELNRKGIEDARRSQNLKSDVIDLENEIAYSRFSVSEDEILSPEDERKFDKKKDAA